MKTTVSKKTEPRGSREMWLEAAFDALLEKGVEAVKIQPLATALNLSRTSFYWYFEDRKALLDALIEAEGRDPASLTRGYCANWPFDNPPFPAPEGQRFIATGTPEQIAGDIRALRERGVTTMIVNLLRDSVPASLETMDWFAREVRPLVQ